MYNPCARVSLVRINSKEMTDLVGIGQIVNYLRIIHYLIEGVGNATLLQKGR